MKKLGLLVILVFCMSAITCSRADNGTFTLTDIPSKYNGKYVSLEGEGGRNIEIIGCISYNTETGDGIFPRISKGKVSIPMWRYNESTDTVSRYSGSHTLELEIAICNSADGDDEIAGIYFEDVVFKNGNAKKSWKEGEVDE
jgi:hypothetical protein